MGGVKVTGAGPETTLQRRVSVGGDGKLSSDTVVSGERVVACPDPCVGVSKVMV